MRLWALLPFLAVALALAGPPAFAQPATPPGQERSEEAKRNKDEKKAAQEAKKEAKKDEPDDPGDEGSEDGQGDEDGGGEGGDGEGEGSEGGEGAAGDEQGEGDGEPDGGGSAGHGGSRGQASGGGERSIDGSGSADEDRRSPLVDDVACVDECTSAQDGAVSREREAILAATDGLSASEVSVTPAAAVARPSTVVNGNPAVLALLTLSTFLLLVGLVGGLRALHGLGEG
jgi:hypothetical protein